MKLLDLFVKVNTGVIALAVVLGFIAVPFMFTDSTYISFAEGWFEKEDSEGVVAGTYDIVQPTAHPSPTATPTPALTVAHPIRIEIPSLNIDARIEDVGVTDDNVMEIPEDFDKVGWFDQSLRPGQAGEFAAIMSGHYDRTDGSPAVFFNLEELAPDDEIIVTDEKGLRFFFKVESQLAHPLVDFPTEIVYGAVDFPSLKLITCDGIWHSGEQSYSDRLVVTSRLVKIEKPV